MYYFAFANSEKPGAVLRFVRLNVGLFIVSYDLCEISKIAYVASFESRRHASYLLNVRREILFRLQLLPARRLPPQLRYITSNREGSLTLYLLI